MKEISLIFYLLIKVIGIIFAVLIVTNLFYFNNVKGYEYNQD